ncbi:MAG: ZIP family metal transporter [Clostridia bacterium]|nr:ZIP family metal transporter [Clostridia bacterium]
MQWFFGLDSVMQALIASLFTYAMTALGASLVFFSKKINERFLTAMTGAAAGIMIAAAFFSLLLPALEYDKSALPVFAVVTLGFLLGGAFIVGSDLFLTKINALSQESRKKSALLYSAVTLHNIPEGMAVGVAFASVAAGDVAGVVSALMLAIGIGVQNFPEGVCVAYPLKTQGYGAFKSFFLSQASGIVEIPAAVFGALAVGVATGLMPWTLSFSAGATIAVVCSELIPECFEKHKITANAGVIFGFALMMLLDVALG